MCDRIVIIDRGQILKQGTVDDLTPDTGLVRFELESGLDRAEALVAPLVAGVETTPDGLRCRMRTEETDRVIDALRGAGISIRAVSPERQSLESSFIDLVVAENRRTSGQAGPEQSAAAQGGAS